MNQNFQTRRAFLSSASRSLASVALLGCAASLNKKKPQPISTTTQATRKPIRPQKGKVLFIAGQGGDQLQAYLDNIPIRPGGFTLYCSISGPPDSVDVNGLTRDCNLPGLDNSVLHLSVGWMPDFDLNAKDNNKAITTGAFDESIGQLAEWCAVQPRPILLRIGYEFDRGLPVPNYHYDPVYFGQGFRRIVDHLRVAGADNVASVLASTNAPPNLSPALTTELFNRFYPGDDYVDWLGCSMWRPMDIDTVILNEARKRNKPVLLAETSPVKFNIGQNTYWPYYVGISTATSAQEIWDNWHQPMIDFIKANSDVIAGWHYIAEDWSADSMWSSTFFFEHCDARPWVMPEFLKIWNARINAAPFVHASANLFGEIGYS